MRNIKIVVEYDGTGYFGWQRQDNFLTVQQVIEEAAARIAQEEIAVIGSGRTDAGVHALGQVANFRTRSRIPEESFLRGLNSLLPADVAIRELVEVAPSFHARYDAKSKVYLYRIWNARVRSPLLRNYAWFVRRPLDLDGMRAALSYCLGTYDFSSFCAAGDEISSRVRSVTAAGIEADERGMVTITMEADGFLRHMVRNIAGTLVEIGRGKRPVSDVPEIMAAMDRRMAGVTAPPQGLFLKEVKY